MVRKEIRIGYEEYASVEEMSAADRDLCRAAVEALEGSYAPYSHFHVGAAVRLSDGTVVKGANQENAAYPSGLCAERTAMFSAGANFPGLDIVSIAIVARQDGRICSEPVAPCGACRQVMIQYQNKAGKPMSVILVGADHIKKFARVDDILPLIFDNL
ncbi:MAG: cytidine deaminase [Bacteroidales bacterium]|nr:cytidine deaminase [Bacteroidales bacterium]MBR5072699.1 cytidine deaminase [Bacteroidales bacterium]